MGRVSKSGVHRIEKSIGCRTLELQKLLPVGFLNISLGDKFEIALRHRNRASCGLVSPLCWIKNLGNLGSP